MNISRNFGGIRYIFLDFDGALAAYNNSELDISREINVANAELSDERIATIIETLNALFASENIVFVSRKPENVTCSTIYVGKSDDFAQYGKLRGVAETNDYGDVVKDDEAFVLLSADDSNEKIIETIAHEAGHLTGTVSHEGEGIYAYAAEDTYTVSKGATAGENELAGYTNLTVEAGGKVTDLNIENETVYLSAALSGQIASAEIHSGGVLYIGGSGNTARPTITDLNIYSGGALYSSGTSKSYFQNITLHEGGMLSGGLGTFNNLVVSGGTALTVKTTINNLELIGGAVSFGQATIFNATVSGGHLHAVNAWSWYMRGYLNVLNGGKVTIKYAGPSSYITDLNLQSGGAMTVSSAAGKKAYNGFINGSWNIGGTLTLDTPLEVCTHAPSYWKEPSVTFDFSERDGSENNALVSNLNYLYNINTLSVLGNRGSLDYAVNVKADQNYTTYLIGNDGSFFGGTQVTEKTVKLSDSTKDSVITHSRLITTTAADGATRTTTHIYVNSSGGIVHTRRDQSYTDAQGNTIKINGEGTISGAHPVELGEITSSNSAIEFDLKLDGAAVATLGITSKDDNSGYSKGNSFEMWNGYKILDSNKSYGYKLYFDENYNLYLDVKNTAVRAYKANSSAPDLITGNLTGATVGTDGDYTVVNVIDNGAVSGTTLATGGTITVNAGGLVDSVKLSGGTLTLNKDANITGAITVTPTSTTIVDNGASWQGTRLNFNIYEMTSGNENAAVFDAALLSKIDSGISITISSDPDGGTYKLGEFSNENETISIYEENRLIGTIKVNNGEFVKDDLRISAVRGQDNIVSAVLTYTPVDLIISGAIISSVESATGTTIGANGDYDSAFVGGGYFNGEITAGGAVDMTDGEMVGVTASGARENSTYTVQEKTVSYSSNYNRDTVTYDLYDQANGNLLVLESATVTNVGVVNISGGEVDGATANAGGVFNISGGEVNNAVITSGGVMTVIDGVINGAELSGETTTFYATGTVERTSYGSPYAGTYNELGKIITDGGILNVSGGKVNNAKINSGGIVNIYGGSLNNAVVGADSSELYKGSRYTEVSSGSKVYSSTTTWETIPAELNIMGGVVNNLVASAGMINITGGTVENAQYTNAIVNIASGATLSGNTYGSGALVYATDGVVEKDVTIIDGVYYGANTTQLTGVTTLSGTTVPKSSTFVGNISYMHTTSSQYAGFNIEHLEVLYGGTFSGRSVQNTYVTLANIHSGGTYVVGQSHLTTANLIGGLLYIDTNGNVGTVNAYDGKLIIKGTSSWTIENLNILKNDNDLTISLTDGGQTAYLKNLNLAYGRTITIKGDFYGFMNNVNKTNYTEDKIKGVVQGTWNLAGTVIIDGIISVSEVHDAKFNFDLTERSGEDGFIVSNLYSIYSPFAEYSISVKDGQDYAEYKLGQNDLFFTEQLTYTKNTVCDTEAKTAESEWIVTNSDGTLSKTITASYANQKVTVSDKIMDGETQIASTGSSGSVSANAIPKFTNTNQVISADQYVKFNITRGGVVLGSVCYGDEGKLGDGYVIFEDVQKNYGYKLVSNESGDLFLSVKNTAVWVYDNENNLVSTEATLGENFTKAVIYANGVAENVELDDGTAIEVAGGSVTGNITVTGDTYGITSTSGTIDLQKLVFDLGEIDADTTDNQVAAYSLQTGVNFTGYDIDITNIADGTYTLLGNAADVTTFTINGNANATLLTGETNITVINGVSYSLSLQKSSTNTITLVASELPSSDYFGITTNVEGDLKVNVSDSAASNEHIFAVYGAEVTGNVTINISGDSTARRFAAGFDNATIKGNVVFKWSDVYGSQNRLLAGAGEANVEGSVFVTISGSETSVQETGNGNNYIYGNIYAGTVSEEGVFTVGGNITTNLNGITLDGQTYGGSYANSNKAGAVVTGNTSLTIENSTHTNWIFGGSFANGGANVNDNADTNVTLKNTTANYVVGGGRATGAGSVGSVVNTSVTIYNSTVNYVIGGSYANSNGSVTVNGSSCITLDSTNGSVVVNKGIYIGSYAASGATATQTGAKILNVSGNANITVNGFINGGGAGSVINLGSLGEGKFIASDIHNVEKIAVTGSSDVVWESSENLDLSDVSIWQLTPGATLNWQNGSNSFDGDSIIIGQISAEDNAEEWTLLDFGSVDQLAGIDTANFCYGSDTQLFIYDEGAKSWSYSTTSEKLTISVNNENDLVMKKSAIA